LSPLETAGLTIFVLVLFSGVFLTIFGLPGSVIIFLNVLAYTLVSGFEKFGWRILLALFLLTVIAEAVELFLGANGIPPHFGSSKKGVWAAIVGSMIGSLCLVGYLLGLGIMIGIFLGGFTGVILFELKQEQRLKPALRITAAAMMARIAGTVFKGSICIFMAAMVFTQIYS
jgi:uncharacterized protein YqgC (DUF456 family)